MIAWVSNDREFVALHMEPGDARLSEDDARVHFEFTLRTTLPPELAEVDAAVLAKALGCELLRVRHGFAKHGPPPAGGWDIRWPQPDADVGVVVHGPDWRPEGER